MTENQWGSNLSFLLAMIGSAVGLGNIWRYPYVLYSNGGGAFYIPYIVAILLMGIPFLIMEYGVGYNFNSSFPKAIRSINPKLEYLGWFVPVLAFMIMIYYSTILGWDGIYVILSFFKGWGTDPNTFFTNTLLHSTDSVMGLTNFIPVIAIAILVVWVFIWFISHKNLEDGLGKFSKLLVPLLFLIMVMIVIFSITLPGSSIGLNVLFHPDWSLLGNFDIWMAAFGQVIFSMSLGMTIAFTYASYINEDTDLIKNTVCVALANSLFENFAALGVFSVLGYMSLQTAIPVDHIVTQGTGLVFIVYATAFNVLGQWGYILGPLFFFTVYLAGLTSILALLEPLSFSIQNKFSLPRSKTVSILVVVGVLVSMIYATAFGNYLLGIVDTFINQIAVFLAVILECIVFAWMFKAEKILDFVNVGSKRVKLGKLWLIIVKYVLPISITVVWIGGLIDFSGSLSITELIITVLVAVIIIVATVIFTHLPAKNSDWDTINERF